MDDLLRARATQHYLARTSTTKTETLREVLRKVTRNVRMQASLVASIHYNAFGHHTAASLGQDLVLLQKWPVHSLAVLTCTAGPNQLMKLRDISVRINKINALSLPHRSSIMCHVLSQSICSRFYPLPSLSNTAGDSTLVSRQRKTHLQATLRSSPYLLNRRFAHMKRVSVDDA